MKRTSQNVVWTGFLRAVPTFEKLPDPEWPVPTDESRGVRTTKAIISTLVIGGWIGAIALIYGTLICVFVLPSIPRWLTLALSFLIAK